jgi:hypothetical protein
MLIAYDWIHEAHFLGYAVNGVRTAKPDWLDTINVPCHGTVDWSIDDRAEQ